MKKETSNDISVLPGILFVAGFSVIITIIVLIMNYINTQKNLTVVKTYTDETNTFIQRNQAGINIIFNTSFDEASKCNSKPQEKVAACREAISSVIHRNNDQNITDYSSLLFIRFDKQNGDIQGLRLSGDVFNHEIQSPKMKEVAYLLNGEKDQIKWDDYFYQLEGSEVVIPVKINGTIQGAIVRGVIE